MDRDAIIDVDWAESPKKGFDLTLWAGFQQNPLVIDYRGPDGSLTRQGKLVHNRASGHLMLAYGFGKAFQLGVDIPGVFYQDRDFTDGSGNERDFGPALAGYQIGKFGVGDVRVMPKFTILRQEKHGIGLAIMPTFTIPTAYGFSGNNPNDQFLGDTAGWNGGSKWLSFTGAPELILSRRWENGFKLATNLGFRIRPKTIFGGTASENNLIVGNEFFGQLGFGYDFKPKFDAPVSWDWSVGGTIGTNDSFSDVNENGLEILSAATWSPGTKFQLIGGAGMGIIAGYGVPDWRAYLAFRYSPRDNDRDDDGISDSKDQCPDTPEDRDGFEDKDGCPDTDNDADGILDVDDKCPDDAEDMDTFEDVDGCPDPDNDQDGVLDVDDRCPLEAGVVAAEGCPIDDRDQDGIKDDVDECPDRPGLAERNGCPIPDMDGDGVEDSLDECPKQAGPAMFNGCPDGDGDGIPDIKDKCPTEKEVLNGVKDEDGCPDEARIVYKKCEKIELSERVYFASGKSVIRSRSYKLLNEVANLLKQYPNIVKIRIEGHTDSVGNDDFNQRLSKARADAVKRYMVRRGIDGERLAGEGFGESNPIDTNASKEGRANNRRVEFNIVDDGCDK